jgi:hypothetical protein
MIMKKWVNVFVDIYDKEQYYVTKSYGTKIEALLAVRNHMKDRYIATIDLSSILNKVLKPKKVGSKTVENPAFGINPSPATMKALEELGQKLNKIMYMSFEDLKNQYESNPHKGR